MRAIQIRQVRRILDLDAPLDERLDEVARYAYQRHQDTNANREGHGQERAQRRPNREHRRDHDTPDEGADETRPGLARAHARDDLAAPECLPKVVGEDVGPLRDRDDVVEGGLSVA